MDNYIIGAMIVTLVAYLVCEKISAYKWEKEYRRLVQQFILYKASAENRVGAGLLMQEKMRGIVRPQQKVEERPKPDELRITMGTRT